MGIRITPVNAQPVHCSTFFEMQATSAETNVASISSYLGLPVKVLTTFVKDSPIAKFIKADLRRRNMDFEGPEVPQEARGAIDTNSILQTADSDYEDQGYTMIVQEK